MPKEAKAIHIVIVCMCNLLLACPGSLFASNSSSCITTSSNRNEQVYKIDGWMAYRLGKNADLSGTGFV